MCIRVYPSVVDWLRRHNVGPMWKMGRSKKRRREELKSEERDERKEVQTIFRKKNLSIETTRQCFHRASDLSTVQLTLHKHLSHKITLKGSSGCWCAGARPKLPTSQPWRTLTLNKWGPVVWGLSAIHQLSWSEQGCKGAKSALDRGFALFSPKHYMFVEHSHG